MTRQRKIQRCIVAGCLLVITAEATADRLLQSATEARTCVYFKASLEAVQRVLPAGWVSMPGTGALKGANVVFCFVEGIGADGADGKPMPNQAKSAIVAVPARNEKAG